MEKPILWSSEDRVISDVPVKVENKNSVCTSVCVSMCGNFGFVGFENGVIEKFNMQSGLNRGTFISGCKIILLYNNLFFNI